MSTTTDRRPSRDNRSPEGRAAQARRSKAQGMARTQLRRELRARYYDLYDEKWAALQAEEPGRTLGRPERVKAGDHANSQLVRENRERFTALYRHHLAQLTEQATR